METEAGGPTNTMVVLRLAKLIAMTLARHDLTDHQYRALGFVASGNSDLAEMSARLVVKRPNITTLIDGLVERGLVERHRLAADRRRVELTLTDSGRAVFDEATDDCEQSLANLAQLGPGDPDGLLQAIGSWGSTVDVAATIFRDLVGGDVGSGATVGENR